MSKKSKSKTRNVKLEKFWRKLANGKIVIVYKDGSFEMTVSQSPIANLKVQYDAFDDNQDIVAILSSPMSSDAYDGLSKRAKDSSVEDVIQNYKKFFKRAQKTPKDLIRKGWPEMEKVYFPK